jgi:signal peptidase I
MDAPSSNGRRRAPRLNGQAPADLGSDTVLTIDKPDENLATARFTTTRSKRGPDYRLRGLDLGAQSQNQTTFVAVPKNEFRLRRRRRRLIGWAVALTVAIAVALLLRATVVEPFSVPSRGMVPTLQVGDRIVVVKSSLLAGPIKQGNIVVFRHPATDSCGSGRGAAQDLVQRVVGLPGQTISSKGDTVYVDGRPLNEPHWYNPRFGPVGSRSIRLTTIPANEYFMMGDNRSQACDSRSFGAVPRSSIVGKVVSVIMRAGHPYIHVF